MTSQDNPWHNPIVSSSRGPRAKKYRPVPITLPPESEFIRDVIIINLFAGCIITQKSGDFM